jgi:polyhydroxyalkanoate synthesis regulator phasin
LIDADALSPEMVRRAQAGELPQEDRQELQRQIRSSIEEQVRLQGSNPNELRPQIETLSRRVEALLLEGTSIEEIQRMLAEGRLRP